MAEMRGFQCRRALLVLAHLLILYVTISFGRDLHPKYHPKYYPKPSGKVVSVPFNETTEGGIDIHDFGGSYFEPMDSPNSNHTNRKLKQDGCDINAIKNSVIAFPKFISPQNCAGFDPSIPNWARCVCSWYRYAFSNTCYSDCYAARWRNCGIRWRGVDLVPFQYVWWTRYSSKLHKCCPFTKYLNDNPVEQLNPQLKVCRMNVSPWGTNGVQIKKRYTVYFWFCTSTGPHVLVPVLFYFRNGVKIRRYPPFPEGVLMPSMGWYSTNNAVYFIPPSRFRDWPGYPNKMGPLGEVDPGDSLKVADATGDYLYGTDSYDYNP